MKKKYLFALLPLMLTGCNQKRTDVELTFRYCNQVITEEGKTKYVEYKDKYEKYYTFSMNHVLTEDEVKRITTEVSLWHPNTTSSGYHRVDSFSLSMDDVKDDFKTGLTLDKDMTFYYFAY